MAWPIAGSDEDARSESACSYIDRSVTCKQECPHSFIIRWHSEPVEAAILDIAEGCCALAHLHDRHKEQHHVATHGVASGWSSWSSCLLQHLKRVRGQRRNGGRRCADGHLPSQMADGRWPCHLRWQMVTYRWPSGHNEGCDSAHAVHAHAHAATSMHCVRGHRASQERVAHGECRRARSHQTSVCAQSTAGVQGAARITGGEASRRGAQRSR